MVEWQWQSLSLSLSHCLLGSAWVNSRSALMVGQLLLQLLLLLLAEIQTSMLYSTYSVHLLGTRCASHILVLKLGGGVSDVRVERRRAKVASQI